MHSMTKLDLLSIAISDISRLRGESNVNKYLRSLRFTYICDVCDQSSIFSIKTPYYLDVFYSWMDYRIGSLYDSDLISVASLRYRIAVDTWFGKYTAYSIFRNIRVIPHPLFYPDRTLFIDLSVDDAMNGIYKVK